jgi:hypothetical protein
MLKEKKTISLVNTLLLHIPLLALMDGRNDSQRNEYTRCTWAGGTFFPVVLLCQFLVLAGNRFWFYILTYLEYNQLWRCVSFSFWWEIVCGFTYLLSVQYSCAVVTVFWLWREIVLKMRKPFEFLLGCFIMIR